MVEKSLISRQGRAAIFTRIRLHVVDYGSVDLTKERERTTGEGASFEINTVTIILYSNGMIHHDH
jgi:hypothetical protein